MIIVTTSFWKSSFFKTIFVHTETQRQRFQIPPVWREFSAKSVTGKRGRVVYYLKASGYSYEYIRDSKSV